jgi:uncharacterized protein
MSGAAPGAVAWFEIDTVDPDVTEAFYAALFGWRFEHDAAAAPDRGGRPHGHIVAPGAAEPMGAIDVLGPANGNGNGLGGRSGRGGAATGNGAGHAGGHGTGGNGNGGTGHAAPHDVSAISILAPDVGAMAERAGGMGATVVAPPAEVGDGTVVAHVRDPLGNLVALVSGPEHAAAGAPTAPGGFARFEIGSTDVDVTRRFYERAFGWGFEPAGDGGYFDIFCPDARAVSGGLWDQSSGDDYATFSILTDALAPAAGRARKLGARQLAPASRNPDGVVCARLLDPGGAQFGLVALPREPADPAP